MVLVVPLVKLDCAFYSAHLRLSLRICVPILFLALFLPICHPPRIIDRIVTAELATNSIATMHIKSYREHKQKQGYNFQQEIKMKLSH